MALLKSAAVCAAAYLPWFLFAWLYYGSPIPQTVVAKGAGYDGMPGLAGLWETIREDPSLGAFMDHLLFVEQPFHRDAALGDNVRQALAEWPDRPPMIIDESDGELTSAAQALERGYVGTSHKNCKGVFKGVANACLIEHRRRGDPGGSYTLSSEDLGNVGPVALAQDLAVLASLAPQFAPGAAMAMPDHRLGPEEDPGAGLQLHPPGQLHVAEVADVLTEAVQLFQDRPAAGRNQDAVTLDRRAVFQLQLAPVAVAAHRRNIR